MRSSRRWQRSLVLSLSLTWLFCPIPSGAVEPTARTPSVLLLFSLRSGAPAVVAVESAFRETVQKRFGAAIDLHVETLDLADNSAAAYTRRLTDLLQEKYARTTFDLVVTAGSDALAYFLQNRELLAPAAPLVFTSVSREAFGNGPLPPNTTGSFTSLDTQRTVRIAVDLHPDAQQIVLVGGAAPSDRANEALARRLAADRAPKLPIVSLVGLPLSEQLERLADLPQRSVVIFTSYRADATGRSTIARDVLPALAEVSKAPIYGASETFLGLGIVGGDLIQYGPFGVRAGELTARILRGEATSAIAPLDQPSSALIFDWRELRRWGISESRLPEGSLVRFRQPTLWSEYRWQILAVVALTIAQWLLITALLAERRRRRSAQKNVEVAELRYRTVADFTQDCEYWKRPDGSLEYISPSCERLTGYSPAEFLARPQLLDEMVVGEHRPAWQAHLEADAADSRPQRLEFQVRVRTGELRWVEQLCAPVLGPTGDFLGTRVSARDITERKRAEEELRAAFAEIRELRDRFEAENVYLKEDLALELGPEGIVGESDALHYVLSRVKQVAPTSSTVLLLGETGVGKELIARAIHSLSSRQARTLVRVNCAALPPTLIESELFGHEKGAFTGAIAQRKGRFETADGSTLFLDEIGELPLDLQPKLLRVIQEGEFERVGGNRTIQVDVRLIAATNRVLEDEIRKGRFREDLWYRLNVFPITVPPLRKRRQDIQPLARHFIAKVCRKLGRPALELSKATLADLEAYDWPGNVRELESVLERAVITSPGPALRLGDPLGVAAGAAATSSSPAPSEQRTLEAAERDHIVGTLERLHWRLEGAGGTAEVLGINASTLRSRMRKLGIQRPGGRVPPPPAVV